MAKIAFYGSLMQHFEKQKQLKVTHQLQYLQDCVIHGRLYDLDQYPGLVLGEGLVKAELYEVLDPRVMPILDAFEGYNPKQPEKSYYIRNCVRLASPDVDAYVYFYRAALQAAPIIDSGDWLQFHTQK